MAIRAPMREENGLPRGCAPRNDSAIGVCLIKRRPAGQRSAHGRMWASRKGRSGKAAVAAPTGTAQAGGRTLDRRIYRQQEQ